MASVEIKTPAVEPLASSLEVLQAAAPSPTPEVNDTTQSLPIVEAPIAVGGLKGALEKSAAAHREVAAITQSREALKPDMTWLQKRQALRAARRQRRANKAHLETLSWSQAHGDPYGIIRGIDQSDPDQAVSSGFRVSNKDQRKLDRQVRRRERNEKKVTKSAKGKDIPGRVFQFFGVLPPEEHDESASEPIYWRAEPESIPEPSSDPRFLEQVIGSTKHKKSELSSRLEQAKKGGVNSGKVAYHGLRAWLYETRAKRLEKRADKLEDPEFIKSLGSTAMIPYIEQETPQYAQNLRKRSVQLKAQATEARNRQEQIKNGDKEPELEPIHWFSWRPPAVTEDKTEPQDEPRISWRNPEATPQVIDLETQTSQPPAFESYKGIWRDKGRNRPVTVLSFVGIKDGRRYVEVAGSSKAVPEDAIVRDIVEDSPLTSSEDEVEEAQAKNSANKPYDAWNDMLGYVASISGRGPDTTMSPASIEAKLEKRDVSKEDAQKIYQRLVAEGIVSGIDVPGVGHRILMSAEDIRKLRK